MTQEPADCDDDLRVAVRIHVATDCSLHGHGGPFTGRLAEHIAITGSAVTVAPVEELAHHKRVDRWEVDPMTASSVVVTQHGAHDVVFRQRNDEQTVSRTSWRERWERTTEGTWGIMDVDGPDGRWVSEKTCSHAGRPREHPWGADLRVALLDEGAQGGWFAYVAIVAQRPGLAVNLRSGPRPLEVGAPVIVGRPIATPEPVRITLVRRWFGVPQTKAVLCPVMRERGHPRIGWCTP